MVYGEAASPVEPVSALEQTSEGGMRLGSGGTKGFTRLCILTALHHYKLPLPLHLCAVLMLCFHIVDCVAAAAAALTRSVCCLL